MNENVMRQCHEADRERILAYIAREPEMNLFIYGDVENYGVDKDPVCVYVNEKPGGIWDSLLLFYHEENAVIYSDNEDFDIEPLVELLRGRRLECLSGKLSLVNRLASSFSSKKVVSTYMCRCREVTSSLPFPLKEGASLHRLTALDAHEIEELLSQIEEFSFNYRDSDSIRKKEENLRKELERGALAYGVFVNGKLVSTASTSAANSQNAMIVGVATDPNYRGQGFASLSVWALCEASLKEGRSFLCLFYDNPEAGKIYRKIGFREIGEYGMMI
jgi:uncharacterized protein